MRCVILFAIMICCSIPGHCTEVFTGEPTKVLVITDNEGKVILREPTALDYQYSETQAKEADTPRSLKDIILGRKKCHKHHH